MGKTIQTDVEKAERLSMQYNYKQCHMALQKVKYIRNNINEKP